MKFYAKATMRDLLSQGLYMMMQEKPFEKITIKQICDKTGVNRGTFYNHFMDKYETLEYLTYRLLIKDYDQELNSDHYYDFMMHIVNTFYENKDFFSRAFEVQGQNSFDEMFINIFTTLFLEMFEKNEVGVLDLGMDKEFLASYQANGLLFVIRYWIQHNYSISSDRLCKMIFYLYENSNADITKAHLELK